MAKKKTSSLRVRRTAEAPKSATARGLRADTHTWTAVCGDRGCRQYCGPTTKAEASDWRLKHMRETEHPVSLKETVRTLAAAPIPAVRLCAVPRSMPRSFDAEVGVPRMNAIITNDKVWLNGTELTYAFMGGPPEQHEAMRRAFAVWAAVGIGISFREIGEVPAADVRIAFEDDGSWSYVGRDIRRIAKDRPTMNIGWDITGGPRGLDTGVHEIGHTLGLQHEHQNGDAGIVWNEEAVYEALGGHPNFWSREKTYRNIIAKLDPRTVSGTRWDKDSVMHYPFEAGLIRVPVQYMTQPLQPAGGLSVADIQWVRSVYPPLPPQGPPVLKANALTPIAAGTGSDAEFILRPERSATYEMRTFGNTDAVMALYEKRDGRLVYLGGADDSATDANVHLRHRLQQGAEYVLRLRMMYVEPGTASNILLW